MTVAATLWNFGITVSEIGLWVWAISILVILVDVALGDVIGILRWVALHKTHGRARDSYSVEIASGTFHSTNAHRGGRRR